MQLSVIAKKRSSIAERSVFIVRSVMILTCALLLLPAAGWGAEGGGEAAAGGGSWLSLLFYVINFAAFVWILVHYAGPAARKFFFDRAAGIKETFARRGT